MFLLLPVRQRVLSHQFLHLDTHLRPIFRSLMGLNRTEAFE